VRCLLVAHLLANAAAAASARSRLRHSLFQLSIDAF
jgi:hypothetical protein